MKTVVITGSTRGIGRGLAENFLRRGCRAVVSGRSQPGVDAVVAALGGEFGAERVTGKACEITDYRQLQALWDHGVNSFEGIDVWINNAGPDIPHKPLWEADVEDLRRIVETNLTACCWPTRSPWAAWWSGARARSGTWKGSAATV